LTAVQLSAGCPCGDLSGDTREGWPGVRVTPKRLVLQETEQRCQLPRSRTCKRPERRSGSVLDAGSLRPVQPQRDSGREQQRQLETLNRELAAVTRGMDLRINSPRRNFVQVPLVQAFLERRPVIFPARSRIFSLRSNRFAISILPGLVHQATKRRGSACFTRSNVSIPVAAVRQLAAADVRATESPRWRAAATTAEWWGREHWQY
jgi:hypothetical protein